MNLPLKPEDIDLVFVDVYGHMRFLHIAYAHYPTIFPSHWKPGEQLG